MPPVSDNATHIARFTDPGVTCEGCERVVTAGVLIDNPALGVHLHLCEICSDEVARAAGGWERRP